MKDISKSLKTTVPEYVYRIFLIEVSYKSLLTFCVVLYLKLSILLKPARE